MPVYPGMPLGRNRINYSHLEELLNRDRLTDVFGFGNGVCRTRTARCPQLATTPTAHRRTAHRRTAYRRTAYRLPRLGPFPGVLEHLQPR